MFLKFYLLLFFQIAICKLKNVNNTLYEVTAFSTQERAVLYDIYVKSDAVTFLNGVTNQASSPMYVVVNQCCLADFELDLQQNDIEFTIINDESVLKQYDDPELHTYDIYNSSGKVQQAIYKKFFDWSDIMLRVELKLKKDSYLVKKIHIGDTYEKRELFVLKISSGSKKPGAFILGGEQGRDWMSPAVILYLIDLLKQDSPLLDRYDLYLMPVFNPDGYDFSFREDRFWAKNRKHFYPEKICIQNGVQKAIGVNVDRNWYSSNSGHGEYTAKESECDAIYVGHKPLTEEEPLALSLFLNSIAVDLMAFINIRGFSNLISLPYAEAHDFSNNYAIMVELLLHASDKAYIAFNVSYNLCCTDTCFYNHSGNGADWVKKYLNIPIVYTIYMNHDSLLPQIEQIPVLSKTFRVIMKETLLLAHNIYGPLFNGKTKMSHSFVIVTLISMLQITGYNNINYD